MFPVIVRRMRVVNDSLAVLMGDISGIRLSTPGLTKNDNFSRVGAMQQVVSLFVEYCIPRLQCGGQKLITDSACTISSMHGRN